MPHLVIDCSEHVIQLVPAKKILQTVMTAAENSGLFTKGDIKVRIRPFEYFLAGEGQDDFIHVFANILEGRSDDQKKLFSERIVKSLKRILPEVPIISMNVRDFELSGYTNRNMVDE